MNNKLFLIVLSLLLYVASLALVPIYRCYAEKKGILDVPGKRSSHQKITPRGGGIVFVLLWGIAVLAGFFQGFFSKAEVLSLLPITMGFAIIGFLDDYWKLSAKSRLMGQVFLACAFVASLGDMSSFHLWEGVVIQMNGLAWTLLVLGIVWSVNLFNFMDGIDGLASIEAIFVLGTGSFIFCLASADSTALLSWAMVMFVLGFLVWNWPKANIFMGDAGSYCLGFLIAAFAIIGEVRHQIPITVWIILYTLFWFDATLTLIRRLFRQKHHWATAHQEHAYQRLYLKGYSHTQVLSCSIALNICLAALAVLGYRYPMYLGYFLVLAIVLVSSCYIWIEKKYPQGGTCHEF